MHGAVTGAPLIALDMYEHSFHMDYGTAAAKYLAAFMANLKWDVIDARYRAALSQAVRWSGGAQVLDAPRGFEPRLTDSESVVLPLDDGAARCVPLGPSSREVKHPSRCRLPESSQRASLLARYPPHGRA